MEHNGYDITSGSQYINLLELARNCRANKYLVRKGTIEKYTDKLVPGAGMYSNDALPLSMARKAVQHHEATFKAFHLS